MTVIEYHAPKPNQKTPFDIARFWFGPRPKVVSDTDMHVSNLIYSMMMMGDGITSTYDYYRDEYVRTGDESAFSKMLDKVRI
jgi:hypothetical protein